MPKAFIIYLLAINVITLAAFGLDKEKAIRRSRRIPEKVLLGMSLLGGSAGGLIAMLFFRHKLRKQRFSVGLPLMLLAQVALCLIFFLR